MPQWTVEHRVFVYDIFVKTESIIETQRRFQRHFNVGRHGDIPSRNTILRWVNNFRTRGSVMKNKPPGPVATVRTLENIDRVREAINRSPRRSARKHAQALQLSESSVRRILHKDLRFHPYKLMIVQELNEGDYAQRSAFAQRMMTILEEIDDAIVVMSDEAHFHLTGAVNKHNCRYWAMENPRKLHQRPLHSPKVTVWCAVTRRFGIIGPYFFEENGITVTVTSARYVHMINNFFVPELRRRRIDLRNVWFQQDGATAHTARASLAVLRRLFPQRLISRFADVAWPPRSPDLSSCDFFLWGYLKARVYENMPRTLDELKDSIRRQVEAINEEMLEKVETNFRERLVSCFAQDGRHLSDVLFRT